MNRFNTIKDRVTSGGPLRSNTKRNTADRLSTTSAGGADQELEEQESQIGHSDPEHGEAAKLVDQVTKPRTVDAPRVFANRFLGWKHQIKDLAAYFTSIANHENHTSQELDKAAKSLRLPFPEGEHFAGKNGMQDMFYHIHDQTRKIATSHSKLASFITNNILVQLETARVDVKHHIAFIEKGAIRHSTIVSKERNKSIKMMTTHNTSVANYSGNPSVITPTNDPHITNLQLQKQLKHQVEEENHLQRATIEMQHRSEAFEAKLCQVTPNVWRQYNERHAIVEKELAAQWKDLRELIEQLDPTIEWKHFLKYDHLFLDPATPYRDQDNIEYPHQSHESTVPVFQGPLARKKRFTNKYAEHFFVLTPTGYLHQYGKQADLESNPMPQLSLYLPRCEITEIKGDEETAAAHEFCIEPVEGQKHPATKTGGILTNMGMKPKKGYIFRARTHGQAQEWHEQCSALGAKHRNDGTAGSIPAAVRSVGYLDDSSDEEGEEEAASADSLSAVDATGTKSAKSPVVGGDAAEAHASTTSAVEGQDETETIDDGSSIEEEASEAGDEEVHADVAPTSDVTAAHEEPLKKGDPEAAGEDGTATTSHIVESPTSAKGEKEQLPAYPGTHGDTSLEKTEKSEKKTSMLGGMFQSLTGGGAAKV